MGIFPQPFIKRIEPTALMQIAQVNDASQNQAGKTVAVSDHHNQKN
jgi:hypothetical protein